ncbi:CDP-glycerol glycerophosphotransferase family protein [Photobacterium kishitanii]|uniref:CDP-glycerol glycerophosphotransferase family protein n=1 Tax=Photobacterium kishitanii TaxID=318456 RepID=UPI00071AED96|nr:CDP-glycerol glycerophosphotransferase family protein [Photobacterium kishitanii]
MLGVIFETIKKQIKNKSMKFIFYKVVEVFYGYPLLFISFLIPRNKDKIVVGSHIPFNDNGKYFYLLSNETINKKRIIWIAKSVQIRDEIKKKGFEVYYKWEPRGIFHSLTAKYYIYTFNVSDINLWTFGNTVKINLWHGIPIKHIEFMAKNGSSRYIYNELNILSRIFALYIYVRPDYFISTSKSMSEYYKKAFRLNDKTKIYEFGMPRCDMFFFSKEKLKKHIISYDVELYNTCYKLIPKFEKTFIYMPTWRDYDFLESSILNLDELNDYLKKNNFLFFLKLHPATKIPNHFHYNYSNIQIMKSGIDIYPIIPFIDTLITDYSSIYYDFVLINKEVILFPFDYNNYMASDRGFIFDYDIDMPGCKCYSLNELCLAMSGENFIENRDNVINKKWGNYRGNSVESIMSLLK